MRNAVSSKAMWAGRARVFMAAISMILALVLLGTTARGGLANEGDTIRLSVGDDGIPKGTLAASTPP